MITPRLLALTAVAFLAGGLAIAPTAMATSIDVTRAEAAASGNHGKTHAKGKHTKKAAKAKKAHKDHAASKKGKKTAPVDAPAEPAATPEVIR